MWNCTVSPTPTTSPTATTPVSASAPTTFRTTKSPAAKSVLYSSTTRPRNRPFCINPDRPMGAHAARPPGVLRAAVARLDEVQRERNDGRVRKDGGPHGDRRTGLQLMRPGDDPFRAGAEHDGKGEAFAKGGRNLVR